MKPRTVTFIKNFCDILQEEFDGKFDYEKDLIDNDFLKLCFYKNEKYVTKPFCISDVEAIRLSPKQLANNFLEYIEREFSKGIAS